jgi:phosphoribosylaminoimidazolecarboxamide formyltransferase/IMP cyclohydrolase
MPKVQRALLSVTDKTGLQLLPRGFTKWASNSFPPAVPAALLRKEGIPVRDVSEVTCFPEMLDGRVKTIHPIVAAGILAIRSNPEHMAAVEKHGIGLIDMVVVNLYEFEKVAARKDAPSEELIENIDIGGPTMIPSRRQELAGCGRRCRRRPTTMPSGRTCGHRMASTYRHVLETVAEGVGYDSRYDRAVSARLGGWDGLDLRVPKACDLRYGENPHQTASLCAHGDSASPGAKQLHGKELSYNNLVDLDAAWQLILEFSEPAAAIIKHTNPCGCAEQATLAEAYRKAFEADPVSAFGGVLAFNRPVDEETATEIAKTFIEAIASPGYTPEALAILQSKKNLRLLEVSTTAPELVVKSISGGVLTQSPDTARLERSQAKVVTQRQPTDSEWTALEFAWKVVKHVKSNAILYANAGQSVSAGAGQMSRVDSVKVGAMKAVLPLNGTVLASDAFFPFPDGLEEAAKHGVTAAIQPGGSVRDADVIAAADRLGIAMVFTGIRHFRH